MSVNEIISKFQFKDNSTGAKMENKKFKYTDEESFSKVPFNPVQPQTREINSNFFKANKLKAKETLVNQAKLLHSSRLRQHALCRKCGCLTTTLNFDRVPSSRIGAWSRCRDNTSFVHHQFIGITVADHRQMQCMSAADRLDWFIFDRD